MYTLVVQHGYGQYAIYRGFVMIFPSKTIIFHSYLNMYVYSIYIMIIYTYTCIDKHVYIYIHIYIYTYALHIYTRVCVYIYIYKYIHEKSGSQATRNGEYVQIFTTDVGGSGDVSLGYDEPLAF